MIYAMVVLFLAAMFCTFMNWRCRRGSSMFMRRDRKRHVHGGWQRPLGESEDVQYVSVGQKWLVGTGFSFSMLGLLFIIQAVQDGSYSTSGQHSAGRYGAFADLIENSIGKGNFLVVATVFFSLCTIVLAFTSFRSSYRETDTYCIIERRGKKKRLDFANIRSYKLGYRPGVLQEISIVDASGEKFRFNLMQFESDSLAKYLIQLVAGELEQLHERYSLNRDPHVAMEISEKERHLDALVSYRNYLASGV